MIHHVLVYKKRKALANVSKRSSNVSLFPTSYEMLKATNFIFYYFRGNVWRKLYLFFSQYNYGNTTSSSSYYTGDRSRGRRGSRLEKSFKSQQQHQQRPRRDFIIIGGLLSSFFQQLEKVRISQRRNRKKRILCAFFFPTSSRGLQRQQQGDEAEMGKCFFN